MKLISQSVIGLSTVALVTVAVLVVFRFNSWAREPQPQFSVSTAPINRDPRLGTSYAPIVKKVAPSVVNIYSTRFVKERLISNPFLNDPIFRQFFGNQFPGDTRERTRKEQSLGSGVIVSADGYILTANHVVAEADEVKVSIADSKKEYPAKIIGRDRATDVAVLKIQAGNLPAVTLADSDQLEIGDVVLALGNPFGIGQTVTMGIVSATGRSGLGFNGYEDFIQTDAAINPGNSGGALVDAEGRLVGINTAIISRSGGNQGIGLAVPVNMARNVLERLVSGGKITHGYLEGIIPQDLDAGLAKQFNLASEDGALIGDVTPDSPAQKAGLQPGDVIVSANDKAISGVENLKVTIAQMEPGKPVTLKLVRNGANKTVMVTLGELPGDTVADTDVQASPDTGSAKTGAFAGVTVVNLNPRLRQLLRLSDNIQGTLVTEVTPDSNSAEAGLQPNDLIVEINRQLVADSDDAVRLCRAARGEQILVKVWRRIGDFAGTRYLSVDNTRRAQ
jgi:serine protease Do